MIYENSARKLVQQLRIFVETQKEQSVELARYGTIYAPKVWQAVYLGNPRVFEQKEENSKNLFLHKPVCLQRHLEHARFHFRFLLIVVSGDLL